MNEREQPVLCGRHLTKVFGSGKNGTVAVRDVDFDFYQGEIVSIVGESGSGKTTLSKMVLGLIGRTEGEIDYNGQPINLRGQKRRTAYWRNVQAIFQDPFSSFNIFNKVDTLLLDCLRLRGLRHLSAAEKTERLRDACSFVNLKYDELANKYPFELSGGQMQRMMIARIFLLHPKVVIADEPTSMIDACSRATVLDMMLKLRDDTRMTIVFITHDIGLAYYVSDKIYIMKQGSFVESGAPDDVILNPKQAYTRELIGDVPKIHSKWEFSG